MPDKKSIRKTAGKKVGKPKVGQKPKSKAKAKAKAKAKPEPQILLPDGTRCSFRFIEGEEEAALFPRHASRPATRAAAEVRDVEYECRKFCIRRNKQGDCTKWEMRCRRK